MDCFNHNCPFRTNETSNVNRCDCYSCKVRDSKSLYVNSNKIITNDTVLKKTCHNCKHWERFCGYCCNKNSKYCSKFVDDGCDKWEMIDINNI